MSLSTGRSRAGLRGRERRRPRARRSTIPPGTVAGEYSLLGCADAQAKVKERTEGNNCRAASLLIAPPPPGALPYGDDARPAQPARARDGGDLRIPA